MRDEGRHAWDRPNCHSLHRPPSHTPQLEEARGAAAAGLAAARDERKQLLDTIAALQGDRAEQTGSVALPVQALSSPCLALVSLYLASTLPMSTPI